MKTSVDFKVTNLEEAMRIRALPPIYSSPPADHYELAMRLQDPRLHEQMKLQDAAEEFIRGEMSRHVRIAIERFPDDRDACNYYILDRQRELRPKKDPMDDSLACSM